MVLVLVKIQTYVSKFAFIRRKALRCKMRCMLDVSTSCPAPPLTPDTHPRAPFLSSSYRKMFWGVLVSSKKLRSQQHIHCTSEDRDSLCGGLRYGPGWREANKGVSRGKLHPLKGHTARLSSVLSVCVSVSLSLFFPPFLLPCFLSFFPSL